MAFIKVTSEEQVSAAQQLLSGKTEMENTAKELRNRVTALTGDSWLGAASGKFSDLYAEFDSGVKQSTDALESIAQRLHLTAQQYAELEARLAAS